MTVDSPPSGRFVLRIDPVLHGRLRDAAEAAGLSLNAYCSRTLATGGGAIPEAMVEGVRRARDVVGDALAGVVAFGSWARGELSDGSDVDLLVVVEAETRIRRGLYRAWDMTPILWESHRVEPHFVELPGGGDDASGLWAEVALDGVVLFERGLRVSRWLAEVRRQIVDGAIVRRRAGGRTYWVRAP